MAAESLAFRRRRHQATQPDEPRAPIAYEAVSSVPEHGIPFIPVHVPGDSRAVELQRAAMPSEVDASLAERSTWRRRRDRPGQANHRNRRLVGHRPRAQ
ncbi:hypothetical protein ACGFMK_23825 [Amycolatopsis sp. NPDC049252]|uniref:hypothetical protein n=1 Tax=Amycolatopsis sp. NPDC049252 TaxID=3363933 RepID=UPI00371A2A4E